jgi:hypothetical protein
MICAGIRPDDHDFGFMRDKFVIILAQLRHVPLAERSLETPVQHQDNVFFISVVGQPEWSPGEIFQVKIGRRLVKFDHF